MSWILFIFLVALSTTASAQPSAERAQRVTIDDFESYGVGDAPTRWFEVTRDRRLVSFHEKYQTPNSRIDVHRERGRQFLRVFSNGSTTKVIMPFNHEEAPRTWDLNQHPRLSWEWRAVELPAGAREDQMNDTGGAVYVTFGNDWLGRPKSIKYTYSSTLPVGSVVKHGPLRVLVVATGTEGTGEWKPVDRDVTADYRQVFGEEPPTDPVSIILWSDSDNTKTTGKVDFDNIRLLPPRQ